MGGIGSTRWKEHKARLTVEDCFELRASQLAAAGVLPMRKQVTQVLGELQWYVADSPYNFPALHVGYALFALAWGDRQMYRFHVSIGLAGAQQSFDARLVPSRVGPDRWMFSCPDCYKSVAALYMVRGTNRFACRRCLGLTYTSTRKKQRQPDYQLRLDPSPSGAQARAGAFI